MTPAEYEIKKGLWLYVRVVDGEEAQRFWDPKGFQWPAWYQQHQTEHGESFASVTKAEMERVITEQQAKGKVSHNWLFDTKQLGETARRLAA